MSYYLHNEALNMYNAIQELLSMKSAGARDGISKSQGSLENGLVIWLSGVRWGGYGIL